MAYDFKKLSDVAVVETVTENTNVLIEEDGIIKKVNKEKVGKDSFSWNELEDKPFGKETKEVVVAEGSFTYIVDEDDAGVDIYNTVGELKKERHIFILDGVRYECEPIVITGLLVFGNPLLSPHATEFNWGEEYNNNIPFCYTVGPSAYTGFFRIKDGVNDKEYSLIVLKEQETITTLPAEFLPEGIGGGIPEIFKIECNLNTVNIEIYTAYDDIVAAYNEGKTVEINGWRPISVQEDGGLYFQFIVISYGTDFLDVYDITIGPDNYYRGSYHRIENQSVNVPVSKA